MSLTVLLLGGSAVEQNREKSEDSKKELPHFEVNVDEKGWEDRREAEGRTYNTNRCNVCS